MASPIWSVAVSIVVVASSARAQSPKTAADCHAPTRHELHDREHHENDLAETAARLKGDWQSAQAVLDDLNRRMDADRPDPRLSYNTTMEWLNDWQPRLLEQAHKVDGAHVAYIDAQIAYLTAKKADDDARQRVQECLDDVADAQDARRARKAGSHPATTPRSK